MPRLREADKFNDVFKDIANGELNCPKCWLTGLASYTTRNHGNERALLLLKHKDGTSCQKWVDLVDAHIFEVQASPVIAGSGIRAVVTSR